MQVGASSSRLIDYEELWHSFGDLHSVRFRPVVVTEYAPERLPREEHQLPPGVADPFEKTFAIFALAAEHEERGIKGSNYIHGKAPPVPKDVPDPRAHVDEATKALIYGNPQKGTAAVSPADHSARMEVQQIQQTAKAASNTVPAPKSSTKTAGQKEAEAVTPTDGDSVVGALMTFVPMAGGQAVQTVVGGPLPAMASQAITVAGAVAGATEVAAVGISEGLKEEEPVVVRRGLRRDKIERS